MIPRALILALALCGGLALAQEAPLTGAAWQYADQAYKSYDAGNYADALTQVTHALNARPDVARLQLLKVYTLQKLGRDQEALAAAQAAVEQGLDDPGLKAAIANLKPSPPKPASAPVARPAPRRASAYERGYPIATKAYADYKRGDMPAAEKGAERAFRTDPRQGNWALLWLDALVAQNKLAQAESAAGTALALGAPNQAELKARRDALRRQLAPPPAPPAPAVDDSAAALAYAAYARQDYPEAIRQARLALDADPDNPERQRLYTTALASGDRQQAAEAEIRLNDALAKTPGEATLLLQRAYLRQRLGEPELALADFRAAQATGQAPPSVTLDQAYALSALGRNPEAVEQLKQGIDMADAGQLPLDPQQRYNTRSAIANLSREWGASLSAGYRGARPANSSLGGAAISTPGDAVFSTAEVFWRPPQTNNRYGMLEAYARLSNTLYDEGSTFESVKFVDPCTGEVTDDSRARSERVQNTRTVTGWPSTIGALGLRYLLADTGLTFGLERRFFLGSATRQGTLYPQSSLVQCGIQRGFDQPRGINTVTRYRLDSDAGGWMGYMTYGYYHGRDLRTDVPSWLTVEGYSQLGYTWDSNDARFDVKSVDRKGNTTGTVASSDGKLTRDQAFATAELRVGRSFRLDQISNNLVIFPHVVVGADWLWQKNRASGVSYPPATIDYALSDNGRSWSLGVGPGLNLRYWFREDHYNAPRSYFDWSVQYRTPLGGGATERAKGLFMSMTLYY
ncbi:NfrA family protein [Bordetella pseudohinzii]|uniref:NfrA family protein n=1 Tax=Bordetella pseudohinzii TaxID=1331258 RepID=UPI0019402A82|nr:hypothetical protein [Bordetella pseudohinzii]